MHALAKLGQLSLRTLAPKQVAAELVFEVHNGASERWLRHIASFGSPGEIQLTGRRQEISDVLHFHSCSLPLNCERSVRRASGDALNLRRLTEPPHSRHSQNLSKMMGLCVPKTSHGDFRVKGQKESSVHE